MMLRPPAHGVYAGPLDAFVDLGLPLIALLVLWAWSRRGRRKRDEAERRRASGDPTYYTSLPTGDLRALAGLLDARSERTPEDERTLAGARAELERRTRRGALVR